VVVYYIVAVERGGGKRLLAHVWVNFLERKKKREKKKAAPIGAA